MKASEIGRVPSINTTFAQLIRYASIERNEPDDAMDEDSDVGSRTHHGSIDTIVMHTVIQRFCCNSLNTSDQLTKWLECAVHVFCSSYLRTEHMTIKAPYGPRVPDYILYMTHGQR